MGIDALKCFSRDNHFVYLKNCFYHGIKKKNTKYKHILQYISNYSKKLYPINIHQGHKRIHKGYMDIIHI